MQGAPEETETKYLQTVSSFHAVTTLATRHKVLNVVAAAFALRYQMINSHVLLLHVLTTVSTVTVIPVIYRESLAVSHTYFW